MRGNDNRSIKRKGYTVINYIIREKEVKRIMERMMVGNRIESDHQPVEVWLRGEVKKRESIKGRKKWVNVERRGEKQIQTEFGWT